MKHSPATSDSRNTPRRGVLSMELVLTLPILGVVLLGLFEFTWLFYSRSLVVEASRVGARKASLPGASLDDVERDVRRTLPVGLQREFRVVGDVGQYSGDVVWVGVEVSMRSAAPDLLWPIGIGLNGRNLYSETRMVRE